MTHFHASIYGQQGFYRGCPLRLFFYGWDYLETEEGNGEEDVSPNRFPLRLGSVQGLRKSCRQNKLITSCSGTIISLGKTAIISGTGAHVLYKACRMHVVSLLYVGLDRKTT